MDHTVVHFEIPADNVENLKTFYEKLFAWKIIKVPMEGMDYWIIQTVPTDDKGMIERPGVNGGMISRQYLQKGRTQINYIVVENMDDYVAKVTALGGKLLAPKVHVPEVGFTAIAQDPEGNEFGLLQPDMP